MNPPTITVLMPTFNRAPLIAEAIASILQQTFADLEIIVIDDGSSDNTSDVLSAFTDQRLRVLSRPHRGISASLNAGLAEARGRYIARLDSDDLWQPDLLATLVPVLEAQADIGVVYAQADALDHGVPVAHLQGLPLRFPDDSLRSLVYDDCTCNIALLARRECFGRAGPYDESLLAHEDWDMWLRVAQHFRFAFVDRVLARVRWHDDNLTGLRSAYVADVLNSRTAPLDKLFAQPDLPPAVVAMRGTAYANVHLFVGLRWTHAGQYGRALRSFRLCVSHSDRPLVAVIRIAWRAALKPTLDRWSIGRAAVRRIARLYRRVD